MAEGARVESKSWAREVAFRLLFLIDVGGGRPASALKDSEELRVLPEDLAAYVRRVVRGVTREREALDALFAPHLQEWRMERLAPVDRNLIRLAIYELKNGVAPPAVAISEAVNLADRYGNEDSPKFVNAILGSVAEAISPGSPAPPRVPD